MAQLQKGQSYPEMGFRVDNGGIAYDLTTGQSLAKADVDARLAQSGTGMSNLDKKRGGINGFYDDNKGWLVPVGELAVGALTGGAAVPAMIGAGAGLNSIKHPNLGGALTGGITGGTLGKVGQIAGGALGIGGGDGLTAPKVPNIGVDENGMPTADPNWGGVAGAAGAAGGSIIDKVKGLIAGGGAGGAGGGGLQLADILKALGGGVDAGLNYKNQQAQLDEKKNEYARTTGNQEAQTAVSAQNLLNRAPMADNAQALLRARMAIAPTTFAPRDYTRTGASAATMQAPAQGGAQDQLAAARAAAANYTPGSGGVDTSALELLKKKMYAQSGMTA